VGQLEGKVVLLSGGASDIGRATALLLAAEGAAVAVGDVIEDAAAAVAADIVDAGGRSLGLRCDVREEESVAAFVRTAVDAFAASTASITMRPGATHDSTPTPSASISVSGNARSRRRPGARCSWRATPSLPCPSAAAVP
jgi:NAD(P)-dependent dehydrogenase (short-subunit alcohol dehydrogenase family)